MKIYFAGSIRGGRNDVRFYVDLIKHLRQYGEVLTEHIGDKDLSAWGEEGHTDKFIHDRDLNWLLSAADVIIADVSTPSLGVGYEIGKAVEHGKRGLCLYRQQAGKRLSPMIAGCPDILVAEYDTLDEAKEKIDEFFK